MANIEHWRCRCAAVRAQASKLNSCCIHGKMTP